MGGGRHQVAEKARLLAVGRHEHALMVGDVSGGREDADPRHDLPLALHEVEQPRLVERDEVAREVARRGALVGAERERVLAALHHVARPGKARPHRT